MDDNLFKMDINGLSESEAMYLKSTIELADREVVVARIIFICDVNEKGNYDFTLGVAGLRKWSIDPNSFDHIGSNFRKLNKIIKQLIKIKLNKN